MRENIGDYSMPLPQSVYTANMLVHFSCALKISTVNTDSTQTLSINKLFWYRYNMQIFDIFISEDGRKQKNMVNHTNNQCLIDIVHKSASFKIRTHYIDWKHAVITDNTTFVEFIAHSHSTSQSCTLVLQHCKQCKS